MNAKAPTSFFEQLENRQLMSAGPATHHQVTAPTTELMAVSAPLAKAQSVTLSTPKLRVRVQAPDQIRLVWSAVDGASSYRVERSVGKELNWQEIRSTSKTAITNNKLKGNRLYRYRVIAIGADASEVSSGGITVRPNAALAAMSAQAEKVATLVEAFRAKQTDLVANNLDLVSDADFRYSIKKAQRKFAKQMAALGVTYKPQSVEQLMPEGVSGAAPRVSSTPPTISATTRTSSELAVNWNAGTGGLAYKIERSANAGTTWSTIAYSTGIKFVDVGLTADTSYQYRVSMITASDTSAASSVATAVTSPVAPGDLAAATTNSTTVALTWTAVANATSYTIERSTNTTTWAALTPGTPLTGTDAAYSDATGAAGTTYYYRITTVNGSRNSAASGIVAATTVTAAPTVTATATSGSTVNLTWTAQATAFEYKIERSLNGTTWADLATTSAAHFVDDGLTANTDYHYRVSATNAGGTSAASTDATVTTLLGSVANFAATPSATLDKVALAWDLVTDATDYRIDRSTNQTTWSTLTTSFAPTDHAFDDTTVNPGTTYYYRIFAVNTDGRGAASPTVNALTRPATPANVAVTATSVSAVSIAWDAVPTASSYTVEKSIDGGTSWTTVSTPSGTNTTDSGLAADRTLQYRVTATNATGDSDASTGTVFSTAPATPANVAVTFNHASTKNVLVWDVAPHATSYILERQIGTGAWTTITPGTPLTGSDHTYDDTTGILPGTTYNYRVSSTNSAGTSPASAAVSILTEAAVPTLTGSAGSATTMNLTWTASATATGYTLQSSPDGGTTWTTVYAGTATSYTDTGLTANTDYSYQVKSTNATGSSEYGTQLDLKTTLVAPSNLAATVPTADGTRVALAWDVAANATGFKIERSANAGTSWTVVTQSPTLAGSAVAFTDTGLTANTAYQYRISAISAAGTSTPSAVASVTTRVGTPTNFVAAATSATNINLTWTAVTGATSYKVETSTDGGTTWSDLATPTAATYSNTGLTANTSYQYRVSAVNTLGAGAATSVATVTTFLAAPSGFSVASTSNTSATLTWTPVTDATGYKIERSANAGSTWTTLIPSPVLAGSAGSYVDTTLTASTSYQYRVSAIGTIGTSAATSAATVLTRTAAPVVTGAVNSATQVTLTWPAITGATSYLVQKSTDSGTSWSSAGTPTAATLVVTGLTANTPYQFRVYGVNAAGNSAASNVVAARTTIAAPTGFATTSVTSTEIRLAWNTVTDATSYKLERALGTGAYAVVTPATPFTGSSNSYINSALVAGTTYKYRISATNTLGTSATSSELTVLTRPSSPTVTASTTSTSVIALSWAAVPSATSYKVELSGDGGTSWSVAGTPTATTFNATGLTADSGYTFRVSAINASGAGTASSNVAARTLLVAPTGLTVIDAGSDSVTLAWDTSDNATTYTLERSANAGSTWTPVVPSPALVGTDSSYQDTGLAGGTTYLYHLSATNAAGKSANSSSVTATTLPAAPTLTATAMSGTLVSLSWTASTTATSYRVERSSNDGATWTTIASPTGTSFSDTGVQAAHNYSYRVSAVNASGAGDASAEKQIATLLATPSNVTATTVSATAIGLAWTAPAGATGYKIERSTDTNTWTTVTQSPVLSGTSTYFSNTGLAAGTDYYFRITATAGTGIQSQTSVSVRGTTLLAAPTGLAAVSYSTTQINLTWTNIANYTRTGFKLQRSPNGTNSWTTIATPAANATSYSNTGLTSGTRYFYRLIAVSLAGDSAAGTVVNATTK